MHVCFDVEADTHICIILMFLWLDISDCDVPGMCFR